MDTLQLAMALLPGGRVVGLDLSGAGSPQCTHGHRQTHLARDPGDPTAGDGAAFLPVLAMARGHGLKITVHVGEVLRPEDTAALLSARPDRIGRHGCFLVRVRMWGCGLPHAVAPLAPGHATFLDDAQWQECRHIPVEVRFVWVGLRLAPFVAFIHRRGFSDLPDVQCVLPHRVGH